MMPESVEMKGVKMGPIALHGVRKHPVLRDLFDQLSSFDLTSDLGRRIAFRLHGALWNYNYRVGRAVFGYPPAADAFFASTRGALMTKEQVGFRPYLPGKDNPIIYGGLLVLLLFEKTM